MKIREEEYREIKMTLEILKERVRDLENPKPKAMRDIFLWTDEHMIKFASDWRLYRKVLDLTSKERLFSRGDCATVREYLENYKKFSRE